MDVLFSVRVHLNREKTILNSMNDLSSQQYLVNEETAPFTNDGSHERGMELPGIREADALSTCHVKSNANNAIKVWWCLRLNLMRM